MKRSRKREEQLNNRPNIMLCLAFILLFLAGVSTSLVSGLYARYTSTGTGNDAARVASFEVNAVTDNEDTEYDMGREAIARYKIALKNNSEVAVSYNITLTFENELPNGVKPVIAGNDGSVSADQKIFIYENIGEIPIGSEAEKVLEFVPDGSSILDNYSREEDQEWAVENAFHVNVEFVQVD